MISFRSLFVLGLMLPVANPAFARTFDINTESHASYFSVTGGPSTLGQKAFEGEASSSITYDKKVEYNYTGEIGFLYSKPDVSFRFGFEVFKPQTLSDVSASNGSYSMKSSYTGYAPKFGMELNLHKTGVYRTFLQAFLGSASLSLKNDYTLNSYAGLSDHSVEAKGTGRFYGTSLGVESHFTDTTTYVFEFGYRVLEVEELTYSKDVSTFSGNKTVGQTFADASGAAKKFQLTGGFISLGFRFYL